MSLYGWQQEVFLYAMADHIKRIANCFNMMVVPFFTATNYNVDKNITEQCCATHISHMVDSCQ